MNTNQTPANVLLIDHIWQSSIQPLWRNSLLCLGALALLIVSGKISVFTPFGVPLTMQTYVIVLLPMIVTARISLAAMSSYLALGLIGVPVFAAGGGLAYFVGPTAGYLVGFMGATALLARLATMGWDKQLGKALLAMLLAMLVIFACGFAWLSLLLSSPAQAWTYGVQPFIAADSLKIALAAVSLNIFWRLAAKSDTSKSPEHDSNKLK